MTRGRAGTAVVFTVHGALLSSWTAHIPAVQAHLGLDDAGLGLVLLGAPAGAVLAVAGTGAALPRLGSRRAVRVALVGYCLAGLLVGLAGSPLALAAALGLWGLLAGALDVSMNTQAVFVERRAGRTVMSGLHGAWGLGAFLGAGLGAAGVAVGATLLEQLAALGALALSVGLAATRSMLADEPMPPRVPGARRRPPAALLLLAAAAFASMLCEGAAADWSAVYLRTSVGTAAAVAGLGYTVFALALLLVRVGGDRLLQRRPARLVVPPLAVLAAAGLGLGLAVGGTAATLIGLACLGGGLGLVVPAAIGAAGRLPGRSPGRSVATVSGIGLTGFVVGPPLIGQLAGASSLRVALVLLPILCLLAAGLSRRMRT